MTYPLFLPVDPSQVSDGYHTFSELYEHRALLWMNLLIANKERAVKTRLDDEGCKMDGFFIAGMNTEYGQISYHLVYGMWPYLNIKEVENNSD